MTSVSPDSVCITRHRRAAPKAPLRLRLHLRLLLLRLHCLGSVETRPLLEQGGVGATFHHIIFLLFPPLGTYAVREGVAGRIMFF